MISPLLANIYLHWFDKAFHRADGPAQWAKAKLVRYADDFVVLARYQSQRLRGFLEAKLEGWLGLTVNREKTRVVELKEPKASLDFLGYTFRFDRDRHGGNSPVSEPGTIGQGAGPRAGGAAADDRAGTVPHTPARTDQDDQPASARMGEVFQSGLSAQGVSADQLVCSATADVSFAAQESARLPPAGGRELL